MSDRQISQSRWYHSPLVAALAGSLLMWAALPPLALGWLAWIAPIPWLFLIRRETLSVGRPYRSVWLGGFALWLATLHWLRLPHPALYLGWLALSAYLASYLPVFVGLSRVAVHRLHVPLWLAAPIVWTGLELARAHLLTGFLMASLAHTQINFTTLIQISDVFGEYGVDFLVMLVAASITGVFSVSNSILQDVASPPPSAADRSPRWSIQPLALLPGIIGLAVSLAYGHWRVSQADQTSVEPTRTVRIALIQGNSLAEWKADPNRERQIMEEYLALSERAVQMARSGIANSPVPSAQGRDEGPSQTSHTITPNLQPTSEGSKTAIRRHNDNRRPLDLIVWPETMFRTSLVTFDPGYHLPAETNRTTEEITAYGPQDLARLAARLETPVLVGVDRVHFGVAALPGEAPPPRRYNSAALVSREGHIIGTYDKVHRVMFGEYIPFADWLPFLYRLTPLTGGIEPGRGPVILEWNGTWYAPNICYETVIPHVIRRQAAALVDGNRTADVLVNLTNDAWYWGSSELDMHLACGVFRAVETRKPLVIAANGGISAYIDRCGRIRAQSPRQQPDILLADVELSPEHNSHQSSWYVQFGDWFAGACLACCLALAVIGWHGRHY